MPVKSNQTAKSAQGGERQGVKQGEKSLPNSKSLQSAKPAQTKPALGGKAGPSTKPQMAKNATSKPAAHKGAETTSKSGKSGGPVMANANKVASAPKAATPKDANAKPTPAKATITAAQTSTPSSTAARGAAVKSSGNLRPAAVSTQKHDSTLTSQQPRNPMASSSASKIVPQSKAASKTTVKGVEAKAPASTAHTSKESGKVQPVKPSVAPKAATAKTIVAPAVVAAVAARAAEARPASGRTMPAAVTGASVAQRISAPAAPATVAAPVATPKDIAQKAQQAVAGPKKPVNTRHGFKINELVVYPAHGVGRIVGIEEQEIAGMALELFVITFEKDKMTLRVPTGRSQSVMRKLAEDGVVKRAMETLKGKARIKRTMWSRRAQEFEQKIHSGDLVSIAEVVRDLFRAETQPEQSYSERQLYEAALDRMAREIAAVEKIDERGAIQRVTEVLSKSAKSRRAESDAAAAADTKAA